jgi:hypothetical protein
MKLQEERLRLLNKKSRAFKTFSISIFVVFTMLVLYLYQIYGTFLS